MATVVGHPLEHVRQLDPAPPRVDAEYPCVVGKAKPRAWRQVRRLPIEPCLAYSDGPESLLGHRSQAGQRVATGAAVARARWRRTTQTPAADQQVARACSPLPVAFRRGVKPQPLAGLPFLA